MIIWCPEISFLSFFFLSTSWLFCINYSPPSVVLKLHACSPSHPMGRSLGCLCVYCVCVVRVCFVCICVYMFCVYVSKGQVWYPSLFYRAGIRLRICVQGTCQCPAIQRSTPFCTFSSPAHPHLCQADLIILHLSGEIPLSGVLETSIAL